MIRREFLNSFSTKMALNWREIGAEFGWDERKAHIKFDCLENKHLDKWNPDELQEILKKMDQLYETIKTKREIQLRLDNIFHYRSRTNKNQKQLENVIAFHFQKL